MTSVAIGGTFNILHVGHKALLERAFELGDMVHIGLTTDEMATLVRDHEVHPYEQRRKALMKWIQSRNFGKKFAISPISNNFGLTLERDFDYLVVSPETVRMADKINFIRNEEGKPKIKIDVVDHVMADDGLPVSSTRIANGEITRDGAIQTVFTEKDFPILHFQQLSNEMGKRPILIHACCAPCVANPLPQLLQEFLPIGFFYNCNIHPFKEYQRRLETMQGFSIKNGLRVIYRDEYNPEYFMKGAIEAGLEKEKRCAFCYRHRLEATADLADRFRISTFTTSLLSSPHQDHEMLKEIGEQIARDHDLEFFYYDLRDQCQNGVNRVKEMDLFVQNYCGCLFSEKERFAKPLIRINGKF